MYEEVPFVALHGLQSNIYKVQSIVNLRNKQSSSILSKMGNSGTSCENNLGYDFDEEQFESDGDTTEDNDDFSEGVITQVRMRNDLLITFFS